MKLNRIALCVALACAGPAANTHAQQTPSTPSSPPSPQQLDRVTITGSNIRRTDQETVAPVTVITREQIERSGQSTVADVLRNIPANTTGSYNESFTNSFAAGSSGISLRGLGQKATLVLFNGRRVAGFGFAQNLQDVFVDLNSIPTSAVERIEVLRDGASAIYGSDALAGVVNVILRRDFRGFEAALRGGISSRGDTDEQRASLAGGFGDLGAQKFNVFAVLDYYKREGLKYNDRPLQSTRDFRGRPGGTNAQSLNGGGTWQNLLPSGGPGFERRAHAECPAGDVLNFAQARDLGLITDPAFDLPNNTWCRYDLSRDWSALPGTERVGLISRATIDLSSSTQAFVEAGFSRNETQLTLSPTFPNTSALRTTPNGSLAPYAYNVNVAPGVGGNPFGAGVNARYVGNLVGLGQRTNDVTAESLRLLAGLKTSVGSWEVDSAAGYSNSEVEDDGRNRASQPGLNAVLGITIPPFPNPVGVPISTGTTYNFDRPSLNNAALRNQITANYVRLSESELKFIDTRANTELGRLPGGPIGLALGVEYRNESIDDKPAAIASSGGVLGTGITATRGSRHNVAAFGELALPVVPNVEAQVAVRGDKYSDFGSAVTPKLGIKFKPSPEFLIRANWGRGFRAPSLPEISPSVATFFVQLRDTALCNSNPTPTNCTANSTSGVFAGNPDLKAEKSRSTTIGAVWEPQPGFSIGLEVFEITWSNQVASDSFQTIVDNNNPTQVIRDAPTVINPFGPIVTVLNNYRNVSSTRTSGAEVDLAKSWRSEVGRIGLTFNAVYTNELRIDGSDYAGNNNNGPGVTPRWRGVADLNWDHGASAVTLRTNYIHSYSQVRLADSAFVASPTQPVPAARVLPSVTTFDLYGRYRLTRNLQLTASVINLTDVQPPFDPSQTLSYFQYQNYDYRGTFYALGIKLTY